MVLGGYLEQALNKRRQREIAEEARVKAAAQARRAKALEEQIAEAVDKTVNKVVAEAVALAVNKALPEAVPEAVDKAVEKAVAEAVEEFRPKWSTESRDEINELWRDWNQRRMEAASKGEHFPEPTPDVSTEAERFTMVVAEWLEGVLERRPAALRFRSVGVGDR